MSERLPSSGADAAASGLIAESAVRALLGGALGDPFGTLGPHQVDGRTVVRVFYPGADGVILVRDDDEAAMTEVASGVFALAFAGIVDMPPAAYRLRIRWPDAVQEAEDPYAFGLLLGDLDLHLVREGRHFELGSCLGAQPVTVAGIDGVRFAVWAPNARRVSVVGDFNNWDGRRNPMRLRISAGVWEIFIPRLQAGARYKYELVGHHGLLPLKADPVANQSECPPATASVVADIRDFPWRDEDWVAGRAERHRFDRPLSIYELHAGSWRTDYGPADWPRLADELIPYVKALGFTHIELLPVTGHPFHGSWGYQTLSLFAPHAPLGTPAQFAAFVDRCHQAELGVLLDWVPAHFPTDVHGLARFDGSALYEHEDPREGFHQDWNTLIYNMGRHEVSGFLLASALHWLEHYHIDGLRVDAVASMLYRDYSRAPGEWIPNRHGGRENLEAIEFLRQLNLVVRDRVPGALVIAEESTAWPGVTAPVAEGGLGFHYKWNMGWMHDTLVYMQKDPIYRSWDHDKLTFGLLYAFSERFVLPISHDEVVHGKRSLLGKMPGDRWQQFANLRAYLSFMWTHPGKKLLFMGCELAQPEEWNHDLGLPWHILDDPAHLGVQRLVADLNGLYRAFPALYMRDADPSGFAWVIGDDSRNSVYAYFRFAEAQAPLLVVANFTPQPLSGYRIGVPSPGLWVEALNSDAEVYGGSNVGNGGSVQAAPVASHGRPYSIELVIPPLAVLVLAGQESAL